ncbi:unnamed protein product [Periconia digitata]|uniref:Cytochrome P450 n=1 Tax=Periconia digitata TaxID=1303443 RepID=A0A9W4XLA3_9PLEO|nr:unnamed protein product [Periconia digitata]
MFGFKHTLNNFNHDEVVKAKSRLLGRLIQVQGTSNLPKLFPYLVKRARKSLGEQLTLGEMCSDGISLPIACTVRTVTSRIMGVLFFGETISSDPVFADALLRYPKEMVSSQRIILDRLSLIMGAGRNTWDDNPALKELTFAWNISSITSDSDYWNGPEHLAQTLLGVWFAAAHQPWMNLDFIFLQLCRNADIQEALRKEIGTLEGLTYEKLMNLPFLDSFIKETVRLHPLDKLAVRRKALKPYTFASGSPNVPAGATVAVSSYDMMHKSIDYPSPEEFQPRRFMDSDTSVRGTKFTEVSEKFPVWGYGSLACPGRFHASIVMKLVIAHFVMRYDMRLENEEANTSWSWETFIMPYESTRFVLRKRED